MHFFLMDSGGGTTYTATETVITPAGLNLKAGMCLTPS